ncbi:hypothetical protein Cgig2_019047 [Carnegiea gigantea]|uniref:Uncharacterized protein n=1 Tax=Carnegiea gigantea TaxID=171969 RepID=A0A9Q1QIN2_9CARY|nr:hypothetical protein Cgig2_019047 [Carnegiea gigantea]
MEDEKFSPTVLELLCIYAELCCVHTSSHVYWNWWLDHFYRGELIRDTFGKGDKTIDLRNGLFNGKRSKDLPSSNSVRIHLPWLRAIRSISRNGRSISFRASAFWKQSPKGRDYVDMKLSDEDFKFLLSIRSFELPVRIGSELLTESYYPNRFAYQFGFDQVEEAFNVAEIVAKIEGLVDIQRLHLLSSQDSAYTSEIAHMEDNLKELSSDTLELECKEKEILKEKERLRVAKLQDLEKEKNQLNHLVNSIISFNRY